MSPEQRGLLQQFIEARVIRTESPDLPPADFLTAYQAYCAARQQQPASTEEFTRAVMDSGIAYEQIAPNTHRWRCRLRPPTPPAGQAPAQAQEPDEPEGTDRKISIQNQLERLRMDTFRAVCNLRRTGKHDAANRATRAYLDILEAERAEFPVDPGAAEHADVAYPPMDAFPAVAQAHGETEPS